MILPDRPPAPVPAARPPLPARPRLRHPALHRAPDVLQFGVDPPDALVLDGLTPPLARMIDALDGSRPVARVLADAVATGASPTAARGLLDCLHTAGLLAAPDAPDGSRAPSRRRVVVHGGGRVAVAVACLLAAAGVGRVLVEAEGTVVRGDTGTGLLPDDVGRPARIAAAEAVARTAGRIPPDHRPGARRAAAARADLVVLADAARPDPVTAQRLVLDGRRHLPVAADGGAGTVGPLVVPGRTPCLRCEDLVRAEEDPAWPRVAAELGRRRDPAPVALAAATAALAAAEVLALLDDAGPASWGATLRLGADGTRHDRAVRRHPACGCDVMARRPGPAPRSMAAPEAPREAEVARPGRAVRARAGDNGDRAR
ncbi:ThiF family adenylyltransferase [Actinomycetospora cinnamomea]|uniref:Bacteriocin biosynthesis cyclodehydratase domain-containing protein n=1 Tax=Actinomycetospora cinnamomea TaxID=663609 RepID=A0A2U1F8J7_9PSEU|nr:ThiF family adenylyltransferase [Actinomycetospora cinnamomea]PVZ08488.1 bacteriocin biosynthesis cyclodehydratase domain-containing protein [Actinomycetospora cinnamomea]